jgi:tetratricopeptide (TPR) repeat protein
MAVLVFCALAAPALRAATFEELAARAAAAREADQVPQAIDFYRQALQMKREWPEGWFYLGTLFYDSDRYPDAQEAFTQYVKIADKPAGWAFLGLCEFETGGYTQAHDHLQRGLDGHLAPEIEQVVRFHEALLLTRLGLFDQALHWYQPLVQRGIHDPTLISGMGLNSLYRAMLPREIPGDERELVTAAGKAAYAWMLGDLGATDQSFKTLVSGYPNLPGVHVFYATYLLGSHPDEATAELRRELGVNPESVEARAMLALLLVQAGQTAAAAPFAKKAVEDRITSPLAQYAYALTLSDPLQAAEHLEIAEKLDPSNFEYHMALARVYSKVGRHDDARRERKTSIQLAKESAPRGSH